MSHNGVMPSNPITSKNTVPPIKIVCNQLINNDNEVKKNQNKTSTTENKRGLSSSFTTPQSPPVLNIKKAKLFVTPNRYSVLSVDEPNVNDNVFDDPSQERSDTTHNTVKSILLPPIFLIGVKDYIGLQNSIIEIIGLDSFSYKSTSLHLKIQTDSPDNYRNLISFLKSIEAQYHTYQPQSYKALRVVIRNLHPSTPTLDIASALTDIGYTVKNVTNVIHQ